jgi:hypothetical protein
LADKAASLATTEEQLWQEQVARMHAGAQLQQEQTALAKARAALERERLAREEAQVRLQQEVSRINGELTQLSVS